MRRGFTLIELLVVITILAILAGAALPYVQAYVEESRLSKARTDLEEISRALAVFETREGDYLASDVSQLTGRYLNKAPIDPWGKPYAVSSAAGVVYSGGPDRSYGTPEDNVIFPYQPPLALVSAKWVDKNNSGAVDRQNASDQLILAFSRRLNNVMGDFPQANIDTYFQVTSTSTFHGIASLSTIVASKSLVFDVATITNVFTPGSDTIAIVDSHGKLKDFASPLPNFCIASQAVVILPQ